MALARDLRKDFYPYFVKSKTDKSFLRTLISLLNTKEADQLEWTLICLAYLFKILKSYLKKDILIVFDALIPLLDNRNAEHVTNFAAECFAFVARDIQDKDKFVAELVIEIEDGSKQTTTLTHGCGQLLFEIIRGGKGDFHSCAESFLRIYFQTLAKIDVNHIETLHDVLCEMVTSLLENIAPGNMEKLWEACYDTLDSFIKEIHLNELPIKKMLLVMGIALETRDGKCLPNANKFVMKLSKVIDSIADESMECLTSISELVAVLLLSKNIILTESDASQISKKILKLPSLFKNSIIVQIYESFVWHCVSYSQFERYILPEFMQHLDREHFTLNSLELLAKIILTKSPLVGDGIALLQRKTFPIRMRSEACLRKIEKIITEFNENDDSITNPREFLLAVIICPHIIGIDTHPIMNKINKLIEINANALQPYDSETCAEPENSTTTNKNKRMLFILSVLIENQILMKQQLAERKIKSNIVNEMDLKVVMRKLLPFSRCDSYRYIHGLRLLDLIVTYESTLSKNCKNSNFNIELFKEIHNQLSYNLTSRYHTVRRITAHLFDQFSNALGINKPEQSIYSIFFAIESIEPTIHSYREQLLLFQRIEPNERFISSLQKIHEPMIYDPIKYLLGFLYVNFNLLWKPVSELITTYFHEIDIEEFWSLLKLKIDETTAQQRNDQTPDAQDDAEFIDVETCLGMEYVEIWQNNERAIDLVNYRILLWRMIPLCGMLREIKNREIVTMFLDFIEHEYKKSSERDSLTWSAQRKRKLKKKTRNFKDVADEENVDDEKEISTEEQIIPKGTQRCLITMLQVFVNQNNPKQLHREPELWTLYMELLTHRNSSVQKLALDCVAAYKHKYLQPYKEHLYNLVDDGKFKEAISSFKIDKESNLVQPEHRSQLMPIVMRILYSKMLLRVGGQKTPNQLRKSLVMRFLGGCHEDEILIILNMAFGMFEHEFKDDAREMCLNVMTKIDAINIISPSILQSSLDLIDVIQSEFSGLMSSKFLRYIINVLLVIGSTVHGVLEQSKQIDSKFNVEMVKPFKSLRNTCLQNLQRFFEHFETYTWSDSEIDAIFLIFVSPTATKLSQDGLMAVTPLLKLFATFAKTPRLFVLLTRYTAISVDNIDTTPLKYVMDLLIEPKARPLVCLTAMEIIQNLLTLTDDDENSEFGEIKPMEISQCRPIDESRFRDIPNAETLNFGSKILLPYLANILEKFKMNMRKRRGLTKRDLLILSKITELIVDADTSNKLLTVLLPIFVRKSHRCTGEETLVQMMNTIINLFKQIEQPERHIRNIAPMFEQITAVGPRKLLCSLLEIIYNRCSDDNPEKKAQLKRTVDIVFGLNAWDRRWIEQPDYEKRLATYKKIGEMTSSKQCDLNSGLLIIYHSFYFIKYDKDMALRDSASHHLKSFTPVLIQTLQEKRSQELDYLIGTVLLNLVRRTIRDKNENVRNEGIQLLGEIARECSDAHPVLCDLNKLTCKQDREIDFFDNITHLQSQRHGRALLRFCSVAKTLDAAPSPRTLTQFILPLCTMYISNDKHAAKHGLITSAIETIGAVCRVLPWHQYDTILKYYIKNMRYNVQYQKQMVRIVMHILDAFHFDLSKANVSKEEIQIPNESKLEAKVASEKDDKNEENTIEDGEEVVIDTENNDADDFDEELDALNSANQMDDDNAEDADEVATKKAKICIYDQSTVLSASIAKKLVHSIATGLIPTLNNSITALSTYENFHKLNKKKRRSEREEEEILRVPIALAVVKLLQKLPPGMLGKTSISFLFFSSSKLIHAIFYIS